MKAVGTWRVTMSTPMGPQDMHLSIDHQDEAFIGKIASPMGNFDITGTVSGDRLRWEMKAKKPMPITVTFDVKIEGDSMTGSAKLGMLGKSEIKGERISGSAQVAGPAVPDLDDTGPVTGESVDPRFAEPYIKLDEWRDAPVRHRYVNGGFAGTDAKFSLYFPPAEQYQGRFFHNTYPLITNPDIGPFPIQFDVAVGDLGYTLDSGAYYVQTNLGGADRAPPADPAIAAYRVNAAAAKYSRQLAKEMYGDPQAYGYLFGGSGGSYQVMGAAEMTQGVWDGFLPYVLGTPYAIPSMFTIRQHALRVLRKRNKLPEINDAIEPGGSGDPFATLNEEETAALREATQLGYPLRGFWDHERLTSGYYSSVAPITPMIDPGYVDDFWSKPGYLGTDLAAGLAAERFTFDTEVASVSEVAPSGSFPREIILATIPARDFVNAHLVVLEGDLAGKSVPIASINGHKLGFSMAANAALITGLKPGDKVRIDNSWALAMQTYHRHQVPPGDGFYAWNQYRDGKGEPIYPQRGVAIGPVGASNTAGCIPTGRVNGKVLVLECMMDIDALPWQADWYRSMVKAELGARFEDNFAIWFIDNANHENPLWQGANAHIVSFSGALQQGLRDLASWVEKGVKPAETRYDVVDTQIVLPKSAVERGGIQAIIDLKANGTTRAEVTINQPVAFTATITVPPDAGEVVSAEWDFEGVGDFPHQANIVKSANEVNVSTTHTYNEPGTYFAMLRIASHRQGDRTTKYARVQNLGRVRVVVS